MTGSGPRDPKEPRQPQDPKEPKQPEEYEFLVRGQVLYRHGLPLEGAKVVAFHKELRREIEIGSARTDDAGNYEIFYSAEDLPGKTADLLMRAYDRNGKPLAESSVKFSAGRIVKVRLQIDGGPKKTWSEYEQLVAEVSRLLDGVKIAELDESDEHQEVSFVAGKVAQPVERVAALVVAHKLAERTGVEPEIFYGMARENVATNLSAMLEAGPEMRRKALEIAVRRRIIPGSLIDEVDQVEEKVSRSVVALAGQSGAGKTRFGAILGTSLSKAADRERLLKLHLANDGSTEDFWADVRADPALGAKADDLQLTLQFAAISGGHPPVISALRKRRGLKGFRQLAALGVDEWKEVIRGTGAPEAELVPAEVPGRDLDERVDLYAATIDRIVSDALPTETLAYHAVQAEGAPAGVQQFWQNVTSKIETDELDLQFGSVDLPVYLEENASLLRGVENNEAVVSHLQDVQRVFNLTTNPAEIDLMLDAGLASSADITRLGMDVFVQRFEGDMGTKRAQLVYDKAEAVSATTMTVVSQYGTQFNQMPLTVLPTPNAKEIPTLATLFGSLDMCECEHCRSVGGPSAYFTEILAFVKDRALPPQPGNPRDALDVLFGRRPDLGEIELTCENTNTILPYIDLVNEVLERAAVPFQPFDVLDARAAELDARTISAQLRTDFQNANLELSDDHAVVVVQPGNEWFLTDHSVLYTITRKNATHLTVRSSTYQTGAPSDQLAANPEHTWDPAYAELRDAVFPWSLPLDLWREEVVTYLGHLGAKRHELMTELAPGDGWSPLRQIDVAVEYLGLNAKEHQAITGTVPGLQGWQAYGLVQNNNPVAVFDPAQPDPVVQNLEWRQALSWVRVMLDRSGLDYEELVRLLTTRFVNPGGTVRITSADPADLTTCDLDRLKLTNVDAPFLDRLHRFVVAWRHLGWEPHELDLAIDVLQGGVADVNQRLTDDFLIELSHVQRLRSRLALPVDELLTFWGPISIFDSEPEERDSLYLRLFQNPAVLNPVDPHFALVADEPAVVTEAPADAKISTHVASLLAAFGIDAAERSTLADALVPGDQLNRANLSELYRHVLLARGLGLSVEDLLALIEMSGIDPFSAATHDAVYFTQVADRVAASGLSIAEVDYLLNHRSADRIEWDPQEETVATFLDEVRTALRRVHEDTTLRPDPTGDATRATLASLRWSAELVDQVIATLAGTVVYRTPLAALPANIVFPPSVGDRVSYDDAANELTITGPLTTTQHASLRGASATAAWETAVDDLRDQPRDFVEDRMRAYEYPTFRADLAALPGGVVFPEGLGRRVFYDQGSQQLCFAGVMADGEKTALDALSNAAAYRTAVQELYDAPSTFVPNPDNAFFPAGDAADLFDADLTAAQRFELVLRRLLGHLRATRSERAVAQRVGDALGLSLAAAERLLTSVVHADAALGPAIDDFTASAFAASNPSLDLTAAAFPSQFATYVRLIKAVRLADALKLPPLQLQWLGDFGPGVAARPVPWLPGAGVNAGWLGIDDLPVAAQAPVADRFASWMRVVDLVHLRDALKGGFQTVSAILELARDPGPVADVRDTVLDEVEERTGWDREVVDYLTGAQVFNLAFGGDLADEIALGRLQRAVRRARRLGASAAQCRAFAQPQPTAADAKAARQIVKAKYPDAAWREVARPLRDKLRERQRQSLVDYLVARPDPATGRSWRDSNGLYSHFLIDPEMSACAITSRIKQAIGSVQQFVQRCLLNLEANVSADATTDAGWRDWKWMKNYRVWEANRKVFLHPENWLEPELRDDKSPFFAEAQSQLLQNDVSAEVAEDVFMTYLERLESVARLEVAGVYLEPAAEGKPEILHVFGRTYSSSTPSYWYRRREGGRWTAWEKVDLDIGERQLLPIVWNRRLYLFWPVFTEGATPSYGDKPTPPSRFFDLQIAWSEYKRGKWQPKRITQRPVRTLVTPDDTADHGKGKHILRAGIDGQGLKLWYEFDDAKTVVKIPGTYGTSTQWVNGALVDGWLFTGAAGKTEPYTRVIQGVFQPTGTVVDGMTFEENGSSPLNLPKVVTTGESVALNSTPGQFSLSYLHQDGVITGLRPFFYADDARTYLVESIKDWEWGWTLKSKVDIYTVDKIRDIYYTPVFVREPEVIDPIGPVARWGVIDPVPIAKKVLDNATLYSERHAYVGSAGGPGTMPTLLAEHHASTFDMSTTATPFAGQKTERSLSFDMDPSKHVIVAKGDKAVVSIQDYIADDRIDKNIYVMPTAQQVRRYEFKNFFHPYSVPFMKQLHLKGVDGLLERSQQLVLQKTFKARYNPTDVVVKGDPVKLDKYPVEDVDFTHGGAYSIYNWELFFHLPLLIATRLMQNQRFEEAQRWFHFIFDPTDSSDPDTPRRFWRTKPFYEASQTDVMNERIDRIIKMLADGVVDPELQGQIDEWRRNPFKPHAIARLRTTAYQKNVVMRYLDNLIAWGDQLFRRDTIESINEATQLYILAAEILGRRPAIIEPRAEPQVRTFNALDPSVAEFSDEMVEIEYLFGSMRPDAVVSDPNSPPLPLPKMLYFCVPPNDKLLGYWDTVADRLFKIRNCMTIEGVVRQLPLFEPPIDPALLVRAAAAGVDISAALSDAAAPLPIYRFKPLAMKARELVAQVRGLGSALQSALDSRDAEKLALLRADHEIKVQETAEQVKVDQLEEAKKQVATLRAARAQGVTKYLHYQRLLGVQSPQVPAEGQPISEATASASFTIASQGGAKLIQQENNELSKLADSHADQEKASDNEHSASIANIFPSLNVSVMPWGIGLGTSFGGPNIGNAFTASANRDRTNAAQDTYDATRAGRIGTYVLREQDWVLNNNMAAKEIMHTDAQITAALIRQNAAEKELASHRKRMELSQAELEFMSDKFTNEQLRVWLIGKVSEVYFQAYRLAYDVAKRAERAYRFELGLADSNLIQFGYWDSLKKGLLAGEQLELDLQRMEVSHLDLNRREHEQTKHVSLNLVHPEALVDLRETGSCFVDFPEAIFDLDTPGHYMRRIKSLSVTIPCTTGPYTNVSCKITQLANRVRTNTSLTGQYPWKGLDDNRFAHDAGGVESIVTSSGREDAGLFQLDFRDDRYLPFEGRGAISQWRLELPAEFRQFDYQTISDVVFHVRYTARDGGASLRAAAATGLTQALKTMQVEPGLTGPFRLFQAASEFPDAFHRLLHPLPDATSQELALRLGKQRFPMHVRDKTIKVSSLAVILRTREGFTYDPEDPLVVTVRRPSGATTDVTLTPVPSVAGGLPSGIAQFGGGGAALSEAADWVIGMKEIPAALGVDVDVDGQQVRRLDPEAVADIGILCNYSF